MLVDKKNVLLRENVGICEFIVWGKESSSWKRGWWFVVLGTGLWKEEPDVSYGHPNTSRTTDAQFTDDFKCYHCPVVG